MDNYEIVEKLTKSFVRFLDKSKFSKYNYRQLESLTAQQKLMFIKINLKPYKNTLDKLILDTIEKNGDKLENYTPEDVEKFKKYLEAFIDLV